MRIRTFGTYISIVQQRATITKTMRGETDSEWHKLKKAPNQQQPQLKEAKKQGN